MTTSSTRSAGIAHHDEPLKGSVTSPDNGPDWDDLLSDVLDRDTGWPLHLVFHLAWQPGILDEPGFRKVWVALRFISLPKVVDAALGGHEPALECLYRLYGLLDPTVEYAVPWDHLPRPPKPEELSVPSGVDLETLRAGFKRLFDEAIARAAAGA